MRSDLGLWVKGKFSDDFETSGIKEALKIQNFIKKCLNLLLVTGFRGYFKFYTEAKVGVLKVHVKFYAAFKLSLIALTSSTNNLNFQSRN